MSIYEDIDKDFQNFISEKKPKQEGLLNSVPASNSAFEDMEKEMAQMGFQRSNDNDSWGTVLSKVPLMAAGNVLENAGRFLVYGGKPDYMTDEEYDIYQNLPKEDRANVSAKEWVDAYRKGDPEAARPTGAPNYALNEKINRGLLKFGEELAKENTGNYTPYTAKSFVQGIGGLLPSMVEIAAMRRMPMFKPGPMEEAAAGAMAAKIGNAAGKIPVGLVQRNADKINRFASNVAENAILGQVEAAPESMLEQSDAVQGYIQEAKNNGTYVRGKTEEEAQRVGQKVFEDNIRLNTVTDTLRNAVIDYVKQGGGTTTGKLARMALINGILGAYTEGKQGIIPKEAAGQPWSITDPDIGEAAIIGGLTGGIPGAIDVALDYRQNRARENQLVKDVRNMGQGQDGSEPLTDNEQQIINGIRNASDNRNNPPPPPGTVAAATDMMERNGTPSFEYTRGTRWVQNNDTVNVDNLQDITKAGVGDISTVFYEMTGQPLIITSGTDGAGALHADGTYSHGTGFKIDVSGNGLEDPELRHAFIEYCESKGIRVLDEYEHPSPNSTGGHLDLEFHGYNGAGSVDEYSGPVNPAMQEMEAAGTGMMESDLTGQSFLEEDNGPLFADDTAKAQRDSELENLSTEELQYMMNDGERAEYEAEAAKIAKKAAKNNPYGIPTNLEQTIMAQRNAALNILRRRKVGTSIPVNRSKTSYPTHNRQQATPQQNTTTPYSKQAQDILRTRVAGMDDAALTDAYRTAKDSPTRQIIVDELQKRIDNANNAARQTGAQQEAPVTPMPPKQEAANTQQQQNEGPSLTATRVAKQGHIQQEAGDKTRGGTYDAEQEQKVISRYADQYQDNLSGLHEDARRSRQALEQAEQQVEEEVRKIEQDAQAGNITPEEAEARKGRAEEARNALRQQKAALNNFTNKVEGELRKRNRTGNPVTDGKMTPDEYMRQQANPQAAQQAQAAEQNARPDMDDVLARARKAGIKDDDLPDMLDTAIRAAMGDQKAKKRFDGWKPEIKQALTDILSGNVERTNRNANQEQAKSAQKQEERSNENGKQEKLQKPETGESGNQNKNAQSEQGKERKDTDGKTAEKQSDNVKKEEAKNFETGEYDTGKNVKYTAELKDDTKENNAIKYRNEHAGLHAKLRELAKKHGTISREADMIAANSFSFADKESRDAFLKEADKLVDDYKRLISYIAKNKRAKADEIFKALNINKDKAQPIVDLVNDLAYSEPANETREQKAERLIYETFDDEDEREMALYVYKQNPEKPFTSAWWKMVREFEAEIDEIIEPVMSEMRNFMRQGSTKEGDAEGNPTGRRLTNNAKWWQDILKENKNAADQDRAARLLAVDVATGERTDVLEGYQGQPEAQSFYEENRNKLEALVEPLETLYSVKDGMKKIQDELGDMPVSKETKQEAPAKKAVSVEENIANGKKALKRVIETHEDVENAMYREDVGNIEFVWGNQGKGEKFKGGYGISHIIAKRTAEGLDADSFLDDIPNVIATGEKTNEQNAEKGDRITISKGDHSVILSLYKNGERKTWLLTGFDTSVYEQKNKEATSSATEAVYDADGATNDRATRSRPTADEVTSPTGTISQNQQESKSEASEKKPAAKTETAPEEKTEAKQEQAEPDALAENLTEAETESVEAEAEAEPEAESILQPEEVPETLREKSSAPQAKIEDFGQKIGGARKDMYISLTPGEKTARPKSEKKADDGLKDRPWLRGYDIKQGEDGKWTIIHKESEEARKRINSTSAWISGIYGSGSKYRPVETKTYDSKEEAEHYAAIDAVSEKHRVTTRGSGDNATYEIIRRIGGKQDYHWFTIKSGFKTDKEAMTYMALHPEEILKVRTSFGEADLPKPEIKGWNDARKGKAPKRLKADQNATADMFTNTFGFRGVQFGNWENQIERQSVMNAAYEGLLDLAEIMGVNPKIISLNGELGLAFGARGQGLSGAVAHYEPGYTVINLTKMKGAGSLAHEWMHALDHYLMIKGGVISNERDSKGKLTASNFNTHASDSDYQLQRCRLNGALKLAFRNLKNTAFYKEVVETKDETDALKWEQAARERLDKELNGLRQELANDRKYGSKKKAATEEQLKRFDELATKLAAADEQQEFDFNYSFYVFPTMRKMSELVKEITGKALLKKDPSDAYKRLSYAVRNLQVRKETLADAQAKKEFTKQVPTEYSRNNTTIDRGRSTEYWTKPTEMLARAFSAFVEDSAKAKGYSTDFLSYGSDNRLIMFGKPFPEGKEREAINQAFREFFKEVQKEIAKNQKETGEIRFSIRAAAKEQPNNNTRYQAAYHGSPHVFDTFSVEHIGSGEGHQAHGWGLYFAQNEGVAKEYKERLSETSLNNVAIDGVWYQYSEDENAYVQQNGNGKININRPEGYALEYLSMYGNKENAIKAFQHGWQKAIQEDLPNSMYYRNALRFLQTHEFESEKKEGSVFAVEIPEDDVLLDEQLSFKKQNQNVQKKFVEAISALPESQKDRFVRKIIKQKLDVPIDELTKATIELNTVETTILDLQRLSLWKQIPTTLAKDRIKQNLMDNGYTEKQIRQFIKEPKLIEAEVEKFAKEHNREELRRNYNAAEELNKKRNERLLAEAKKNIAKELQNESGSYLYATLAEVVDDNPLIRSPRKASEFLNKHGIKGITYEGGIDGRCFVIFDDKAIQIMQRYDAAVRAHGEEIKRSVDAIVKEVKDAYPSAKDVKVEGNNITFTMPNGVKLTVNIKDQIIISGKDEAKARQDHGLTDKDTGIVVEGYTRKLDNETLVVLSQESSEGTAYHEAMHTVRDYCLTEKENRDLETYYGKKAKEQGIDVDEAIADGYRDWKLARAKGSGTLFGKLYKKIMDFIDTVKAIFNGMHDVHKIYEKIESGDIWNRDAQGRFAAKEGEAKYSAQEYSNATDNEYMQTVRAYQNAKTEAERAAAHEKLTTMVEKAAKEAGFENAIPEQAETYKIRTGAPPKKVLEKVYKVFVVDENGNPTALFVNGGKALPQGVWLDAVEAWHFTGENGREYAPTTVNPNAKNNRGGSGVKIPNEQVRQELIKRGFLPQGSTSKDINAVAYRPGWHGGDMPFFPQAGKKTFGTKNGTTNYDNIHLYNQVIFECEMANEKDYTEYHTVIDKKTGKEKIKYRDMRTLPKNGSYKFATNPMTNAQELGTWYISDSLKIIRALSEAECNEILKKNGFKPQEWQAYGKKDNTIGEMDLERLGYTGQTSDAARKTLAPITYDDDGNVIPLSQRFNREVNDVRYSIREKATAAVEKLANPEEVKYGSDNTGFGRVTQHIGGRQQKNLIQKGLDAWRNLYKHVVDEDTHAHKVDEAIEERTGKKLDDNDSFYNNVRMAGNIAKGHAEWLIAGDEKHGETVKSRIKMETLRKQFNAKATLQNVIDTVADKVMNAKYGDFLEKHKMRDWTQVLETHLAAWRLKEMYNLHLDNWRAEHEAWRKRRDAALARGEKFREKEPVYKPYKLPGNLTIQDINAAIKAAPPEVEQAAQLFYAFNKNNMILLADAGLISGENYQALMNKYKRYCPLMRDFSDTAAADEFITSLSKGGDSVANVSNPLRRISEEGSNRNLLSPLASAIKATAIYCDRAERNKVGQLAVELAEQHKLDDLIWRVPGNAADAKNCIFTVMKDGKKQAYQCLQELYEPIVGYNEDAANMVLSAMSIPARMLRIGATISPTFALRNMIRDTFFAGIASKNGFVPVWDTIRGGIALRNDPEMRAKMEAMGVGMYTFYGNEMNAGKKLGDLQFKGPETLFDYVKGIIKNPLTGTYKALEDFSAFSEQATRMGEFQLAIKNGKSLDEAARDARNLTIDFSRHGSLGKHVNRIIPFFNACVQGTDMMARLLINDFPGTMMKLTKYIILPSIALWALNHDKDWWKELDPDMKNSAWFFETPAGIVRLPKPQEAGVLFGSGMEALLEQALKRDPEAMKNWATAFIDAIKPNVVPTVFLPLLENTANFSYFRMKPIVSRANEKLPGEQQYGNGTSELSKMLGGSAVAHAYNKGGYSPSKIDNFIRGYTGTMGMLLWQAAGEGVRKAQGKDSNSPAKNWQEMPFAREFFANDYNLSRSLNDFYEMASAAQAQHNGYGRKGHPTAAVQAVTKARNAIADERKEIQKITDSKRITPERKQELIAKKREKIKRIAKSALDKYRDKF